MKKSEKNLKFFYIPCRDRAEALGISRTLVAEKLAACGNILDGMTSVYPWNGVIQEDREAILILKTTELLSETCAKRVKELHSYEVPCVIAWDAAVMNEDYISFLENATR